MTYVDGEPLGAVRVVPLYRERYLLLSPVMENRRTWLDQLGGGGVDSAVPAVPGDGEPPDHRP